jgi:hypothetical protein
MNFSDLLRTLNCSPYAVAKKEEKRRYFDHQVSIRVILNYIRAH